MTQRVDLAIGRFERGGSPGAGKGTEEAIVGVIFLDLEDNVANGRARCSRPASHGDHRLLRVALVSAIALVG
jgi:hypothetical protein